MLGKGNGQNQSYNLAIDVKILFKRTEY